MTTPKLWRVAVVAPMREPLTYRSELDLQRGQWVTVPLGKRKSTGLVLGPAQEFAGANLKDIEALNQTVPPLRENFLKWLEWLAEYYHYPLGLVAENSKPPLEKKENPRPSKRSAVVAAQEPSFAPTLTEEQLRCLKGIKASQGFQSHLLHGVTGSGKTEIYLDLIQETLARGQSAIVLVPEISLTPQLIQRFAARFGDQIAAYHSQMTPREKTTHWWEMADGKKRVMIGARSALFCPHTDLGLIIVDEEHEPSYKQDDKLKYHARDSAIMLARFHNCPIVLGSATPSLESWENAQAGKFQLHQLKKRVHTSGLPSVELVDMRSLDPHVQAQLPHWLSEKLYTSIQETLNSGFQVALFLNRRGMANSVICKACGHSNECPNCDIHLTLHAKSHLVCHYCDYHENLKPLCPVCKTGEMQPLGLGTEKLEAELSELFPDKKILRADRDEIQTREDLEHFIQEAESGTADILVGTQMIAKGLDFPKLKLVGLVLADIGFNLPDFRATERSFQLAVQMSGRSGRHALNANDRGRVVIQTFNPDHESLKFAVTHDFVGFAEMELQHRRLLLYPPYGRLVSLRVQSPDRPVAKQLAQKLGSRALSLQSQFSQYEGLEVLGPAEAPLAKLKGQYRYHLLIKAPKGPALQSFISKLMADESWIPPRSRIVVDIDPLHLI